jgi:hypothetical protein
MDYQTKDCFSRLSPFVQRRLQRLSRASKKAGPPRLSMEVLEYRVMFAAPVITSNGGGTSASVSVAENATVVTTVIATDADTPSGSLSYSISAGADADAFTINASTGVLSFVTAPNFEDPTDTGANNIFNVTVRVSDGSNTDSQAIAVTVTNAAEPPAAPVITNNGGGSSASISLVENTSLVAIITATDADTPTASLAYSLAGGVDASKFSINSSSGVLTFISSPNFESPSDVGLNNVYNVVVQVSDGSLTDSQAIAVTITNADETPSVPVITSNGGGSTTTISTAENTSVVTTVTATDADTPTESLTYSIIGGVDAAKFVLGASTGVLAFITPPDFENPTDVGVNNIYEVVVQVSDGAHTDSQTIAVAVTNVAEAGPPPVIISNGGGATAEIGVAENTKPVTTVQATDPDTASSSLVYSISGGADADKFTINSSTGVLNFIDFPNFESPTDVGSNNAYNVTVQVSDGFNIDAQAITVVVTDVVENSAPPVITSDGGGPSASLSVAENTTAVTTVTATDADTLADALEFSISGGADAAKFVINSSSGVLTFISAPDFEAPGDVGANNVYDVTVRVSDGSFTDSQAIAVTVTNINEGGAPPVITSNGGGASASVSLAENTTVVTTVTATDADTPTNELTFSISGGADAADFAIDSLSGVLTFISAPDFEAPGDVGGNNVYDVTVRVTDGSFIDSQAIAVTVTNVVEGFASPVITSNGGGPTASVSVAENNALVTTITATDADTPTNTLTFSITGGADAGKFAVNSSTGVLSFANAPDFEQPTDVGANNVYDVTVAVSDGTNSDSQAIAVTVTNVVEAGPPPVIISNGGGATAEIGVAENSRLVTTVQATDPDTASGSLVYLISGGVDADKFTIDSSTGVLNFIDFPNFESPTDVGLNNVYDVTVQASDGFNIDTQAIAVAVTDVVENSAPPVITSDGGGPSASLSVTENTTAVTIVTATDADTFADALEFSISGGADAAKFVINSSSGVLTFISAPDFEVPGDVGANNVYDVTVRVSDGSFTDSQAIAVTIINVDESSASPVITSNGGGPSASVSVAENTTVVTTVTATDADTPTNALTFSISGGADADKFTINNSTGVLAFASAPDFEQPTDVGANNVYDVTVQVSDGSHTDSQAIAVAVTNVADVNTPPTLTTVSTLTGATEDTPFMITYATLAAAADEADTDGDTVSFRIESVLAGTLTKDGIPITPGVTLLGPGEQLVWTPPATVSGITAAFTITAFDGTTSSGAPVTVSVNLTDQFTHVLTPGANGKFTFIDSQGHKITVAITGKAGTATLIREVADDQPGDLLELNATGTDNTTRITITAPSKTSTNVTDIFVAGPLNGLNAPGAHILGDVVITGIVTTVTLGDLSSDPTLTLGGDAAGKGSTIKLGHATDLVVTSAGPIKSLSAIDWNGGSITAPALDTLKIAGAFTDTVLTSAGSIKSITVGAMNHSSIFIGTAADVDALASSADDFVFTPTSPSLGSLTIKGMGELSFVDSVIDAWNIGKLDLKTVDTSNEGTPLGVAADKIASIKFIASGFNNGKPITLSKLDAPTDLVDPKKNPAGIAFPIGDFQLVLL